MPQKKFQRLMDKGYDSIVFSEFTISERGNILSFKDDDDGIRYHLRKRGSSTNHFPTARQLIAKAGSALGGGAAGIRYAKPGGPKVMFAGGAAGTIIGLVGEMAIEALATHQGEMSYADEDGNEIYLGPVAA